MSTPLVSCLMVTKAGREDRAREAIAAFEAQTYTNKELIVVADDASKLRAPTRGLIVQAPSGATLGALRALSVAHSRGDLIAVWDDDDDHKPERLARQVDTIMGLGADACVLERVTLTCVCGHAVVSAPRSWEATLVAWREILPAYRDVSFGEDTLLMEELVSNNARHIARLDAPELYGYHFWGGNNCSAEHWRCLFIDGHDCWACATEAGLAEPETELTLIERIEHAGSVVALDRVARAVEVFRKTTLDLEERAHAACLLAGAYLEQGALERAQVWALRGLQSGPRADAFCVLGEVAFAASEYEAAHGWYDVACLNQQPPYAQLAQLTDAKRARRDELRPYVRQAWRPVRRQNAQDGHVVVLMTCPGREDLLQRTRTSLQRGTSDRTNVVTVLTDWRSVGQADTFLRALEYAAASERLTALTLIEDDVVFARNALDYIMRTAIDDDLSVIQWYSPHEPIVAAEAPYLQVVEPTNYRPTNQAITLSARAVRAILASGVLQKWPTRHGGDQVFWHVPLAGRCATHYPSIAQHTGGGRSLIEGSDDSRWWYSPTFVGEDFDALSLVR